MTTRMTVRTIERGVRLAQKSQSSSNLVVAQCRQRSGSNPRSTSPCENVKQQISAFVDQSHAEKDELNKLNTRMSAFVCKAKALEAQNQCLTKEIQEMQAHWGDGTRLIRDQYEQSLYDMRGRIDDVSGLKTIADVRNKRAHYENVEFQRRVEDVAKVKNKNQSRV